MSLGSTFKQLRVQAGLSVPKLAAKAGLSSQTVYLIEAGETPGKTQTLEALAKALGYKMQYTVIRRKR